MRMPIAHAIKWWARWEAARSASCLETMVGRVMPRMWTGCSPACDIAMPDTGIPNISA